MPMPSIFAAHNSLRFLHQRKSYTMKLVILRASCCALTLVICAANDLYHRPSSKLSWSDEEAERASRSAIDNEKLKKYAIRSYQEYDEVRKSIDVSEDLHGKEVRNLVAKVEERRRNLASKTNSQARQLGDMEIEDSSYWQRFLQTTGSIPSPSMQPSMGLPPNGEIPTPVTPVAPVAPVVSPIPPVPAPVPLPAPIVAPVPVPAPIVAPVPVPAPIVAPVPVPAPIVAPVPVPAPIVAPVPVPAPIVAPVPVPAPIVAPVPVPAPIIAPVPAPAPVVIPTPTAGGRCDEVIRPVALFGGVEFEDPETYQSKALAWLCSSDLTAFSDEKLVQRYALASIYYATYQVRTNFTDLILGTGNIIPWNNARDWLTNTDECTWSNTLCDQESTGSVVRLDFFNNFLTGEFPPEISLMKATLNNLDVGKNPVFTRGEVFNSWMGTLTELTSLRYEDTNFINENGVPTEIGLLKKLQFYECSNVRYAGTISSLAFPSDMTQLSYIEMEFNTFNSPIPTEIGLLPNLQFFYARGSSITGGIDFMQNLVSIKESWTDDNPGISGTFPKFWGALTNLGGLSVTNCNWSGPLPSELGLLATNLRQLFFFGNSFTGAVPSEFGALTGLTQLRLEDNLLTEQIPQPVCLLKITRGTTLNADCEICPFNCCSNC